MKFADDTTPIKMPRPRPTPVAEVPIIPLHS
jgi:hypothetical protein